MKLKKNLKPSKAQAKTLIVWASLIAFVVLLMFFSDNSARSEKFGIKELMNAAADQSLVEIEIQKAPEYANGFNINGKVMNPKFSDSSDKNLVPRTLNFKFSGSVVEKNYEVLTNPKAKWKIKEIPESSWGGIVITLLPMLLIFGLAWFFISRQMRLTAKGMNFGKSRAKLMSPDQGKVTFADVAGCEEAKEEVSEVVDFLRTPEKFVKIGAKIPKGILMVGPPGTGKTLIARAIAGEADVPFYTVSGSDFVEMFVGMGAARVRDMFETARKTAPCLIFIDEIDAVGRQRGAGLGGGHDEREQTLNSLLVEMDGFSGHEGIIIIAATNRPDVLDNALLRPGRFDRQVVIDLPDAHGREEILKIHAKKIPLDASVDLSKVAKLMPGASGAHLANLLNEGAITAARRNSETVSMEDIEIARDKILYGREHRRLMTEDQKKLSAYHEAGHALVQVVIDDGSMPVHKVTVIPRGQSLGSTMFLPTGDVLLETKTNLLNRICSTLGGRAAEDVIFKEITNGAASDIAHVTKIARKMICDWGMGELGPLALGENQEHIFLGREIARDKHYSEQTAQKIDEEVKGIVDAAYARATEIIADKRTALDLMAEALIEFETIEGKVIYEIVGGSLKNLDDVKAYVTNPAAKPISVVKEAEKGETIAPEIFGEAATEAQS